MASTTGDAKDGGILKYLPEGAIKTLYGLEENGELNKIVLKANLDKFDIIHSHNFENNTLGSYNNEEKRRDWGVLDYDNRPGYPQIVNFDGGKRAKHYFPKGSLDGRNGSDFGAVIKNPSEEVYYSFRMYHEPGFDFYISNKLPGFRMWPSIPAGSGRNPGNGGGVVYLQIDAFGRMNWNVYHHKMTSNSGERMGTPINFYTIKTGEWVDVTYRIVLNTPGESNGILQVWINGELKNTATNVLLRTKTSVQDLNQQVMITCMDWDVPVRRNQSMYMDDFFTWKYNPTYLNNNPSVARGLKLHSASHKLVTPLDQNVEEAATYSITAPASPSNGGKVTVVRSSGND
ncbi:polysaccharide lyase [Algoriphagus jejuensis]|uniref:polysaccharide lyase n=1 Tax=Algoriphagus jejuensis TaxID=419934 RepID=UPI0031E3E8F2